MLEKIIDPKNKTLIPLIIIFFILGVVVGYVAHKPETIEKIVTVNVTVTPIPTPTPAQTPIPTTTPTPTPTPAVTPAIMDFTVKNYEPSKDAPTKTIDITTRGAVPDTVSVRPGDIVLIKITTPPSAVTLILNATYSRNMGTGGAVVVTFNKKGMYSLKVIFPSSDPNIQPTTYAEGTITVY